MEPKDQVQKPLIKTKFTLFVITGLTTLMDMVTNKALVITGTPDVKLIMKPKPVLMVKVKHPLFLITRKVLDPVGVKIELMLKVISIKAMMKKETPGRVVKENMENVMFVTNMVKLVKQAPNLRLEVKVTPMPLLILTEVVQEIALKVTRDLWLNLIIKILKNLGLTMLTGVMVKKVNGISEIIGLSKVNHMVRPAIFQKEKDMSLGLLIKTKEQVLLEKVPKEP